MDSFMQFRKIHKIGIIAALVLCLFIIYIFVEPYWLKVKRITLIDSDIPDNFDGCKIVFAADFHHGPTTGLSYIKRVVKKINEQRPDIVLLGGDYVYRGSRYVEPVFGVLNNIKASFGVYAVLGNHEQGEWAEITRNCMKKYNITLLDNQSEWIKKGNDSIQVCGMCDFWREGHKLDATMGDITEEDFSILLIHNPDLVKYIKTNNLDLVLAGHTHGGQVSLFGSWSPFLPIAAGQELAYGWFKNEYTKTYVTSGIGTVSPPIRFCMRPEIVVMTLEKSNN